MSVTLFCQGSLGWDEILDILDLTSVITSIVKLAVLSNEDLKRVRTKQEIIVGHLWQL